MRINYFITSHFKCNYYRRLSVFLLFFLVKNVNAQTPINDNPCNATEIFINNTCNNPATFSNLNATTTAPNGYVLPGCAQTTTPKDVWFKVKTSNNNSITDTKFSITTNGTPIGQIRIFAANTCNGPFSEIGQACEATATQTVCIVNNAQANTTYYVMVAGYWNNSPTGNFTLCATAPPVAGCTNILANNYSPFATYDNGTCTFQPPISSCGFFSSSPNALITNSIVTTDVIPISIGPNKVLTDLDVVLKLNHSFLSDLDVFLISPSGTTLELFKNICGSFDNMEVRFDDDSYPLQCGNPTKGYYRLPINSLSVFNNEPSDGNWTLKVIDMSPGNNGLLTQWCLLPQVKTVSCFPPIALKTTSIGTNSATLDWTSPNIPQENTWNIELGPRGFSPTGIPTKVATAKPFLYTGLLPYKTYDYYVQSKCLPSLGSSWSGPFTFTTAIPNGQCNLAINIPDNQCNSANNFLINVQNAGGTNLGTNVQIEEVRLIARHTWDSDLNFYLTSPNGKIVELSTKNGGTNDNYGDPNAPNCSKYTAFVRNDCAATSIIGAAAPFIGKFFPEEKLSDFHDGSNPNGNWTLRVCDDATANVGRLEYIELVFSSNTCAQPRNVVISDVKDTNLKINYLTQNSPCNKVIVEYGPLGFTPGTGLLTGNNGTLTTFNCPVNFPLQINGLQPLFGYDIYIREQCSPTTFSPNSCTAYAETNCSTAPITLVESFDNQGLCNTVCGDTCLITGTWHNTFHDDFDWIINKNATPSTNTGPDDDVTGDGKYAYLEAGNDGTCQNGKIAYLMSDCLKVNANADSCAMSFYYHAFGTDINKVALQVSVDGGGTWVELWSISGNQGNRWFKQYIDLQTFKNKIVQFRFAGFGGTGIKADLAIDQIEFYGSTSVGFPSMSYYKDSDGDGFGDANEGIAGCAQTPPNGFVFNQLDCNDNNPNIKPNALEIPCNKIDENCNGMADDAILPSPSVLQDTTCVGDFATLKALGTPKGQFYWYETPNSAAILNNGSTFNTPILTTNKTYYVQDSLIVKSGLRITELDLGNLDAIEIQNIGAAKDYTGWSVVLGNNNLQPLSTVWNLGLFSTNETQYRTRSTGNNFFGTSWNWNYTAKGFALILDNQGIAQDFILFNTAQNDLDNLSFVVNGKTYTKQNLPFKGVGVSGACSSTQTMNLIASGEKNDATDYSACSNPSIGNANTGFNLDYACRSTRIPVKASVQAFPQLVIPTLPEICSGKSIDVRNIVVTDLAATQGVITFHDNTPASTSNQLTTNILTPLNNTNIVLKKTTTAGCSSEKTTTIKVNDLPIAGINASTTQPLCSGQTKTLNATYSGGAAPISYEWSTGAVTSTIQVGNSFPNISGFYALSITDAKGCVDSASVDVFNGSGITSAQIVSIKDVTSCNGNDGTITLKPIDGTPPYKYAWNGPIVGAISNISTGNYTIPNLSKGTYSVTITDSSPLGCDLIIPFLVVKSPDVNIKVDSVWSVTCKGKNDGKIFLQNPNNQVFSYLWSNNKTTKDLTNLSAGKYAVTISSNACSQIIQNILVKEPDSLGLLSAIAADVSCTANGKINITPKGGTSPYLYYWNNGVTVQDLINVPIGNYKVSISDARGCTFLSPDITLKSAPNLAIAFVSQPAKCYKTPSGGIDINVTGGGRPYTYKWNNGATNEDLTNVLAGNYKVSVTDANGCLVSSNFISVGQADSLKVIPQLIVPTCKGFSNGAIKLNASGGTPTYTYQWNISSSQNTVNQLIEGIYKATVTDANNCKNVLDSIKLFAPQLINLSVSPVVNATCVGKANGKIDVNVSGGATPYTYLWSNGATSQDLINTVAGLYQLTLTDANGCQANLKNLVVGGAQVMIVKKDSMVLPTCYGSTDGKIFFEPKNGQQPYTFKWSNNTFSPNIFNLKSDIYKITVTDNSGCELYKTYQLPQPNIISISLNAIDSLTCYGAEDAAIDILVTGGTQPFQFFWNSGQTSEDLSGVPAGDYKLTVLDKNNCAVTSDAIIVPSTQPLTVQLETNNKDKCTGTAFGTIKVNVKGGRPNYKYLWSNGATTSNLVAVPSGTYSVTVTDANDCKASLNNIVILSPLEELRLDTISTKKIQCHNTSDGELYAKILGGKTPFAYNWSNGVEHFKSQRADSVLQLNGNLGFYTLTVTDGLGCTVTSDTIILKNPPAMNILLKDIANVKCKGTSTGFLKADVEGGTPNYTFAWNNNKTTQNIVNIPVGFYKLTVTDANGCREVSGSYEIKDPTNSLELSIKNISNVSCKSGNDGGIFLNTIFGIDPISYVWSKPLTTTVSQLTGLSAGVYSVKATDALGCTASINNIPVPEPQALGILIKAKDNLCFGQKAGSIIAEGLGGTPSPNYNFLWSNGEKTATISNLANGLYKTTLTDSKNCQYVSNDINISSPDSLKVNIFATIATMGLNNGTASANVSGGKAPFTYYWSNGQTTQTILNLAPNTYYVTVTDANNCSNAKKSIIVGTTATENAVNQPVVSIYPNPSNGILYIQYDFFQDLHHTELEVYDLLGKKIATRTLTTPSDTIELDLSEQSCGVYLVGFKSDGKIFGLKKVIVCR
jgi:subtilisin-like proprotein convertase family protein